MIQLITEPHPDVAGLIGRIHNENGFNDIKDYLLEYFPEFTNNRIGTLLTKNEVDNLSLINRPIFQKGKMMVHQHRYGEYKWIMYIKDVDAHPNQKRILTRDDNNNMVKITVFSHSLLNYPNTHKVYPNSVKNMKLDQDSLLEIYQFEN